MASPTKLRVRPQDGALEVLVLITHPMETGRRKDPETGALIPAHFIQEMTVSLNGKILARCVSGGTVSENPLFGFRVAPGRIRNGDRIKVVWSDNRGGGETVEQAVTL